MWFVIIVLLISVIMNVIGKGKEMDTAKNDVQDRIVHPAEYEMR